MSIGKAFNGICVLASVGLVAMCSVGMTGLVAKLTVPPDAALVGILIGVLACVEALAARKEN